MENTTTSNPFISTPASVEHVTQDIPVIDCNCPDNIPFHLAEDLRAVELGAPLKIVGAKTMDKVSKEGNRYTVMYLRTDKGLFQTCSLSFIRRIDKILTDVAEPTITLLLKYNSTGNAYLSCAVTL